jgi:hypothetical protein
MLGGNGNGIGIGIGRMIVGEWRVDTVARWSNYIQMGYGSVIVFLGFSLHLVISEASRRMVEGAMLYDGLVFCCN